MGDISHSVTTPAFLRLFNEGPLSLFLHSLRLVSGARVQNHEGDMNVLLLMGEDIATCLTFRFIYLLSLKSSNFKGCLSIFLLHELLFGKQALLLTHMSASCFVVWDNTDFLVLLVQKYIFFYFLVLYYIQGSFPVVLNFNFLRILHFI